MGVYVLTNDLSDGTRNRILNVFERKGMRDFRVLDLGSFRLFHFRKINGPTVDHVYKAGSNRLVGVGTFVYNDRLGHNALESLYDDISGEHSDQSVFNNIKGHFNIILFVDGEISVVADRVGAYHSFLGREDQNVYISDSFFAVMENLTDVHPRKQELMEFVLSGAIYGPNTLIEEIDYLIFGNIHSFKESGEVSSTVYHEEKEVETGYGLEDHYQIIARYFPPFNNFNLRVTCDLSAGYDSRLVCAIMNHIGADYTFNTNTNTWDPLDTDVAKTIAAAEGRKIVTYTKDFTKVSYEKLLRESLDKTELSRDAFEAAYSHVFFEEKSRDFDMIIGGYGGELYRDTKYPGMKNLGVLVESKYLEPTMTGVFGNKAIRNYKRLLAAKMGNLLGHQNSLLSKADCERIYYHIRMMYWGGARITYFNHYGYRYHPLLDYELIFPLFFIGDDQKRYGMFQMKLMERFDCRLASYPSNYGHNFIWNDAYRSKRKPNIFARGVRLLGRKLKKVHIRGGIAAQPVGRETWSKIVGDELLIRRVFDGLAITGDEKFIGRVYTVESLLEQYSDKITGLE